MEKKDEIISSFAFNTGSAIENLIKEQINNLEETNNMLISRILSWYVNNGKDEKFAKHFGILTDDLGRC